MPHPPLPVGSKRTDRAYGNAGSAFAARPPIASGEQRLAEVSGDRAAARRPPDLMSITRGLGRSHPRSAREEVRREGEPQDDRDDGEEEEDDSRNRDQRRHLAFPRLLDLVQVSRFLFEPFDGVAQPGERPPIEGAGVLCCVPTLRHDSMVGER